MIEPPGRAGSLFGADSLLAPKRSNQLTFHADRTQTGGKGSFEEPERYPGSETHLCCRLTWVMKESLNAYSRILTGIGSNYVMGARLFA